MARWAVPSLAALWLRDLEDPDEGVRAFVGSARHVADYLTDEVLSALALETRDFLVRTSVLDRFTPELCDAVLGREDSAAVLAELAHSNMFLVALDAREEWYRYHHLFGDALQLELGREDAIGLRRRAAAWCREQGLIEDAIEHASSSAFGWRSGSQLSAPSDTRGSSPAVAAYPLLNTSRLGMSETPRPRGRGYGTASRSR